MLEQKKEIFELQQGISLFSFHFSVEMKQARNLQEKTRERSETVTSACKFIKKETLPQVFSCEFCEISKNTFSNRTPPVAASET